MTENNFMTYDIFWPIYVKQKMFISLFNLSNILNGSNFSRNLSQNYFKQKWFPDSVPDQTACAYRQEGVQNDLRTLKLK